MKEQKLIEKFTTILIRRHADCFIDDNGAIDEKVRDAVIIKSIILLWLAFDIQPTNDSQLNSVDAFRKLKEAQNIIDCKRKAIS